MYGRGKLMAEEFLLPCIDDQMRKKIISKA
jgi:hypothetical protein